MAKFWNIFKSFIHLVGWSTLDVMSLLPVCPLVCLSLCVSVRLSAKMGHATTCQLTDRQTDGLTNQVTKHYHHYLYPWFHLSVWVFYEKTWAMFTLRAIIYSHKHTDTHKHTHTQISSYSYISNEIVIFSSFFFLILLNTLNHYIGQIL